MAKREHCCCWLKLCLRWWWLAKIKRKDEEWITEINIPGISQLLQFFDESRWDSREISELRFVMTEKLSLIRIEKSNSVVILAKFENLRIRTRV